MGSRTTAAKKKRTAKSFMDNLKNSRNYSDTSVATRFEEVQTTYDKGVKPSRFQHLIFCNPVQGGDPSEESVGKSGQFDGGGFQLSTSCGIQVLPSWAQYL